MILRFLTSLYVLTRTKSATKYIILWKVIITSFKISNCFYLVIFHKKNLRVLSVVTKMYIFFFDVTPYIIFTHPVFLRLYWHTWHPWKISFPTIYNFMGVKCTHYKLCSVQSKLVYFSQFWGMKHFLGPVCDIWTFAPLYCQVSYHTPRPTKELSHTGSTTYTPSKQYEWVSPNIDDHILLAFLLY